MRAGPLVAIVALTAGPIAVADVLGLDMADLQRVLDGENVDDVASQIAARDYGSNASLDVLSDMLATTRRGEFGETIRADRDRVFHEVRLRLTNTGGMDMGAYAHQFHAYDDEGTRHDRAPGGAKNDFDTLRLGPGEWQEGVLVFETYAEARLVHVMWRGDLTQARGEVP